MRLSLPLLLTAGLSLAPASVMASPASPPAEAERETGSEADSDSNSDSAAEAEKAAAKPKPKPKRKRRRKRKRKPEPEIDDTCLPEETGCFRELDGSFRHAGRAYRLHLSGFDPKYLRAAIESSLVVLGGVVWYWADAEQNLADWDYPSFQQRFTKAAVRFDNNDFNMNFLFHPIAGGAYYILPRTSDVSMGWSFVYSVMASQIWEYGFEFREKVSINDMLMTPGAGMVGGEFFYKLGKYFTSARGTGRRGHRVAAWTFGLTQSVNDAISRKPGAVPKHPDRYGFDADYTNVFRLSYGVGGAIQERAPNFVLHDLRAYGQIYTIPGYHKPGNFQRFFWDGDFSRMNINLRFAERGWGIDLDTHLVLAGVYSQKVRETPTGLRGRSVMVGINMGYLYRKEQYVHFQDRVSAYHLPGPRLDLGFLAGRAQVKTSLQAHFDFAGIDAVLNEDWEQRFPDEVGKTVLRKKGYYYGWGSSLRARLEVSLPGAAFGASTFWGYYNSAEDYDRSQEDVTFDQRLQDYVFDYNAWARVEPWGRGYFVEPSIQGRWRSEYLEDQHAIRHQRRYMLSVGKRW